MNRVCLNRFFNGETKLKPEILTRSQFSAPRPAAKRSILSWSVWVIVCILLSISGCVSESGIAISTLVENATSTKLPTQATNPTITSSPTQKLSSTPQPTATISSTPAPSAISTITPTPDPYLEYTIEYLGMREYGGGEIEIVEVLAENSYFTRYLIRYPSDGLEIYGFLNVPVSEGPYPVIIALHGYIDPEIYNTIDYTTRYADAFARAGYLVFHPNLRTYPPSDTGDNLFRVGMAIDVLNLIEILKAGSELPAEIAGMDSGRIGMWGHSMGGGVTTRVITVSGDVQAAVLYGAMSGEERQNFEAILRWSDGLRGNEELAVSADQLERISPFNYFNQIKASVSIHHGRADQLVPLAWSIQTCDALRELQKEVDCLYYEGMPHTFYGEGDERFIQNTLFFFNQLLMDR